MIFGPALSQLLEKDADELINFVSRLAPSELDEIFAEAIQVIAIPDSESLNVSRALLAIQTVLTENGGSLSAVEFSDALVSLLDFAAASADSRLRYQAMISANLIAQRIGRHVSALGPHVNDTLLALSPDVALSSLVKSLKRRLDRAAFTLSRQDRYALPEIDVNRARENVIHDARQDWFQDPWDWPEMKRVKESDVFQCLEGRKFGWTFAMDVPKASDGVRPAIIVNPQDRIAFQCLADELSLGITNELPHWVYGWRVCRTSPAKGVYEENATEWKSFKHQIASYSKTYSFVLRVDVRSFFESVDTEKLLSDVGRFYRRGDTLGRLARYFDDFKSRRNGGGLPQRCLASSIFAHVPLRGVDRYLRLMESSKEADRIAPLRWMDDIWLFGNSEARLRSVSAEIEVALDRQGLGLNPNKTILDECGEANGTLLADISGAGDEDAESREAFAQRLLEIVDSIGETPRSDINFLLKYKGVEKKEVDDSLLSKLRTLTLDRVNHAADRVAMFLCKHSAWHRHLPWYMDLVRRQADTHSWTVAAWGNMFPEVLDSSTEATSIRGFFKDRLADGIQRSLVPLVAHRTVAWNDQKGAVDPLFSYLARNGSTDDAFVVRSVALAAKQAGWSKDDIVETLSSTVDDLEQKIGWAL